MRAARAARLKAIRTGSTVEERLLAAVQADQHSSTVLKALEAAATSQKAATKQRADKIEWTATWKRLVDDEARLRAEINTCTEANQEVLNTGVGSEAKDTNDREPLETDVVKLQAELEYDRMLLHQRMRALVSNVRHFVRSLLDCDPQLRDADASRVLERVRIQFDAAQDALWELKEQLLLQENGIEDACHASQADVAIAVMETANACTGRTIASASTQLGAVSTCDVPNEVQARWKAFVKLVGTDLSTDALAKLDCFEQYEEMQKHYVDDLLQLDRWFAVESAALGIADSTDGAGGWSSDSHSAYLHVFHPTRRPPKARPIHDVTLELLAVLSVMNGGDSPHNREDILRHHQFCTLRRQFHERVEAKRAQFDREMLRATEQWKAQLIDAEKSQAEMQRQDLERKSQELARRQLHARLASARKRKEAEDAVAREIARDLWEAENAVEEARVERVAAETLLKKAALEAYRKEQATLQARLDAIEAQKEALLAAEHKNSKLVHASRVAFRREVAVEREAARSLLASQEAELERLKEESLQRLIRSVPYRERVEEIAAVSNPDRAKANTAARETATFLSKAYLDFLREARDGDAISSHGAADVVLAAYDAGAQEGEPGKADALRTLAAEQLRSRGQYGRAGYSDKAITSDPRWRFAIAAGEAGIGHTSYARQTLDNLVPSARGAVAARMNAGTTNLAWGDA